MRLPKFLQPYLASYDLKNLDLKKDKELIITEILNKGDDKALIWLGKNYAVDEIKKVVSAPKRGMWLKGVLSYWLKIFNIDLPRNIFEKAIIDLNAV